MVKIVKTIVNTRRELVGFVVEGKEYELGGIGNKTIQRHMAISEMASMGFENNQLRVKGNNAVQPLKNFKINKLPMTVHTPNGYIDIDNSMNLVGRYEYDGENIGFSVRFGDGGVIDIKYDVVIRLSNWFNTENFMIRTSSTGKKFISGKPGHIKLDELPVKKIEGPKGKKVKAKEEENKTMEREKGVIETTIQSGIDILDVYDIVYDNGGTVIWLPNQEYKPKSAYTTVPESQFFPIKVGEIGIGRPNYNDTKLSVNSLFKKIGIVKVGAKVVLTYTFSSKTIFSPDDYKNKIGIAIPADKEDNIISSLAKHMVLKKIESKEVIEPMEVVMDRDDMVFYILDTSKLDLISAEKQNKSLLSTKQIVELCKKQFEQQLLRKATDSRWGLVGQLNKELLKDGQLDMKVASMFKDYDEETLKEMEEVGINIQSGAFTATKKSSKNKDYNNDMVEIEYILDKHDASKISTKNLIKAAKDMDNSEVPDSVINIINSILQIEDKEKQLEKAKEINKLASDNLYKINMLLWRHKATMYIQGGKTNIHHHDVDDWQPDPTSRARKYQVYMNKYNLDLTIKFNGVSI